jgi:hypothetical protein
MEYLPATRCGDGFKIVLGIEICGIALHGYSQMLLGLVDLSTFGERRT